jgi:hypothetical protein
LLGENGLTKLIADTDCSICRGILVPPRVASPSKVPAGADYICMMCGLPYVWVGNPPRLVRMTPRDADDDD